MPLGELEAEVYSKVLVVGADGPLQSMLRDHLRETEDFRLEVAASGFEAGIRAESFHPDCIIIDMAIGRIEAGQIAQNLKRSEDHANTVLIALTSDEPGDEIYRLGFNDGFKKPFDGALLAERVKRLIAQKKNED
jgi:DNA-binding response OmpR family regulator